MKRPLAPILLATVSVWGATLGGVSSRQGAWALEPVAPQPESATSEAGAATRPLAERMDDRRYRVGSAVVDLASRTVTVRGRVNMEEGLIELLACGPAGKTHESVLVLEVEAIHLQTALLLLGLEKGTGVKYQGDPASPTGDPVEVWVEWEESGTHRRHRGEDLVRNVRTGTPMEHTPWVFVGSRFLYGTFAAEVDQSYVTTYHDPNTILDNPLPTGGDDEVYGVNSDLVPPKGTAVVVTFHAARKKSAD